MYTTFIMCTGTSYNNYVTTANSLAASEWYRTREYTTVHLALAIAAHLVAVLLHRMEKAAVATGFYIHYTEISPNQSLFLFSAQSSLRLHGLAPYRSIDTVNCSMHKYMQRFFKLSLVNFIFPSQRERAPKYFCLLEIIPPFARLMFVGGLVISRGVT